MAEGITPREQSYADWYVDIVTKAGLADYSPVKGCMVIKPRGYALWENIQRELDRRFKETGHQNAYFPMLIPESFLKKEVEHVEGFSPELAVVTYAGGEKLDEPLVMRPTSETIIWSMYKKWVQSYRDLPILINQWANVIRWEKRTRLFLRTTEFLWQEGHTAHATKEEAIEETLKMLEVYRQFAEEFMAIPVVTGKKTELEKFAGAIETYSIEAMMQDRRALQAGTSHFLGQNFAKAFDVTFQNPQGELEFVWATSWGVSTRLVGALVMTHSDNKGLILPPKLAPTQLVIIPIFRKDSAEQIKTYAQQIAQELRPHVRLEIDADEQASPGWKFAEWELRGVPLRLEVGPKDRENNKVCLVRRDSGEKIFVDRTQARAKVEELLTEIQHSLYQRALEFRNQNIFEPTTYEEFKQLFEGEGAKGWALIPFCGDPQVEKKLKEETKATIRCLPLDRLGQPVERPCVITGKEAKVWAIFGKAY